jgi:hypothetical protein
MKTKITILFFSVIALIASAKVDQRYNFYVNLVYKGIAYTDTSYNPLSGAKYFEYKVDNKSANKETDTVPQTDALLRQFNPEYLSDEIEPKFLNIYISRPYNTENRDGTGNFTLLVGLRFKNANEWIPICDSVLINKYLSQMCPDAINEYKKLFKSDGSMLAMAGLCTVVVPAFVSFMIYGTASFIWLLPYTAPLYAIGAAMGGIGGLYYSKHNEKYVLDKIISNYNSKSIQNKKVE